MQKHPQTQKRDHASPKDFFLHLLMIVTLYGVAISFTTVIFQTINVYIPDTLYGGYEGTSAIYDKMRAGLATLIVMFPVYLGVMHYLKKLYKDLPGKMNLTIRKWLIYLTLFIAAIIIMIDMIVLINSFLNGELTIRFFLKTLTVLFVAGSIFGYYFKNK